MKYSLYLQVIQPQSKKKGSKPGSIIRIKYSIIESAVAEIFYFTLQNLMASDKSIFP